MYLYISGCLLCLLRTCAVLYVVEMVLPHKQGVQGVGDNSEARAMQEYDAMKLLQRLGLDKGVDHSSRVRVGEKKHPSDSPIFYIKLPPLLYFYALNNLHQFQGPTTSPYPFQKIMVTTTESSSIGRAYSSSVDQFQSQAPIKPGPIDENTNVSETPVIDTPAEISQETIETQLQEIISDIDQNVSLEDEEKDLNMPTLRAYINVRPGSRWNNRRVPYEIHSGLWSRRGDIRRAMNHISSVSCVTFTQRTHRDPDYLQILPMHGHPWAGQSKVGRIGGAQPLHLGVKVFYRTIVHELLHALGFYHEHQRPDRDQFVRINWNNVAERKNFDKYWDQYASYANTKYDIDSIVHYQHNEGSSNHHQSVIQGIHKQIPSRDTLSKTDIKALNQHYKCNSQCIDKHKHCKGWAAVGKCVKKPAWMKANCQAACKQCDSQCIDKHKHCKGWAAVGKCEKKPAWMKANCQAACKQCDSPCIDKHKHCKGWAAVGKCKKKPAWMKANCQAACKQCGNVSGK